MSTEGLLNGTRGAEVFDVLIIGAGIGGINTAYRLQTQVPGTTFTILEGRGDIGGTWDLFRYPGIRSDSDLFTFGFQWEPWPYETPIAKGPLIRDYMKNTVAKYGLDHHIRFHHKVLSADWSKRTEQWKITAEHDGQTKEFRARWVIFGTGYYDYENTFKTTIPGLENFKGKVLHPQHWPEDYDHSGKKMVVIGSGATAVTLFPALSETAEAVTLVQRSPTYIVSALNGSPVRSFLMKLLPAYYAGTLLRILYLYKIHIVVLFCHYFPQLARTAMINRMSRQLPNRVPRSPHFEPTYIPWTQRLCLSPNGDFFQTLRENPNSHIVTGRIDTVTENGLRMKDGTTVEADAIVTATGLHMRMGGNIAITVNGAKVDWAGRLVWNGSMLQDVPNMMFIVGYTNASWTLGADDTAHILTRLLKYMNSKYIMTAVPRVPPSGTNGYQRFWQLTSSYSNEAEKRLPKYGNSGPWQPKTSPPLDWLHSKFGDITTGLHFTS
ncbi:putative flavin-binding monooxygenase [Xylaria bambusicola]|uniref:putative flavin-binding monooxygenase n=1 Tax=Xylaria bambusicola TaxID=326684 RepID=UPI002007E2BF|nr:putative flavin-binding monooxygenase [Xylaria bambusicola]KAI0505201.1 putative flavin-binding monooxygenase [Xylaria bambusicola]